MHFSVMVVGEDVKGQLAPFQETNMGPIAPEYMEKIDCTDEVHDLFSAVRRCFRLADGRYVGFSQAHNLDPCGKAVLIPGAVEVELSAAEARSLGLGYASLDDAAAACGAARDGDRFFTEDNPNSRWDGWVIGGRWGSNLKLLPGKEGYTTRPLEFDPDFAKLLDRPPPGMWEPKLGFCDQARKCDIDCIGMAVAAGVKAGELWDLVRSWGLMVHSGRRGLKSFASSILGWRGSNTSLRPPSRQSVMASGRYHVSKCSGTFRTHGWGLAKIVLP